MLEDELEHTEDAGEKATDRLEGTVHTMMEAITNMANNVGTIATHVADLRAQQAAQDAAHTVREGVNDTLDTAGEAGGTITKAVDVPLAVGEDVIKDSGEIPKEVDEGVKEVAKKRRKFGRRR